MAHLSYEEYPWPPYDKYLQYFDTPLPEELHEQFIRELIPSWKRFQD